MVTAAGKWTSTPEVQVNNDSFFTRNKSTIGYAVCLYLLLATGIGSFFFTRFLGFRNDMDRLENEVDSLHLQNQEYARLNIEYKAQNDEYKAQNDEYKAQNDEYKAQNDRFLVILTYLNTTAGLMNESLAAVMDQLEQSILRSRSLAEAHLEIVLTQLSNFVGDVMNEANVNRLSTGGSQVVGTAASDGYNSTMSTIKVRVFDGLCLSPDDFTAWIGGASVGESLTFIDLGAKLNSYVSASLSYYANIITSEQWEDYLYDCSNLPSELLFDSTRIV